MFGPDKITDTEIVILTVNLCNVEPDVTVLSDIILKIKYIGEVHYAARVGFLGCFDSFFDSVNVSILYFFNYYITTY